MRFVGTYESEVVGGSYGVDPFPSPGAMNRAVTKVEASFSVGARNGIATTVGVLFSPGAMGCAATAMVASFSVGTRKGAATTVEGSFSIEVTECLSLA